MSTITDESRAADARIAVLVLAAEQMYDDQGAGTLEPVLDPRIAAGWDLRGYIIGTDAIFRALGRWALGERRVYYGLVLESRTAPGSFAVVVRGTASPVEWCEDAEGAPRQSAHFPGLVEHGFWGIYDTFTFRAPGGGEDMPLVTALHALSINGAVVVAGHSLGSALATLLAYDAALALPGRVSLRVWASPHVGNAEFVAAAAAVIPDHTHYRNPNDVVCRVPVALGYQHLPHTVSVQPSTDEISVKNNWNCSHHLICYIALMSGDAFSLAASPQNTPYLGCIVRDLASVSLAK